MVVGIGVDIVTISRIESAIKRHGESFIKRVYCENEIVWCSRKTNPFPCYAARFAAKEAVVKALGTGFSKGVTLRQVCIERAESGAPKVSLRKRARQVAEELGVRRIHLTISHETDTAVAFVVCEG